MHLPARNGRTIDYEESIAEVQFGLYICCNEEGLSTKHKNSTLNVGSLRKSIRHFKNSTKSNGAKHCRKALSMKPVLALLNLFQFIGIYVCVESCTSLDSAFYMLFANMTTMVEN